MAVDLGALGPEVEHSEASYAVREVMRDAVIWRMLISTPWIRMTDLGAYHPR